MSEPIRLTPEQQAMLEHLAAQAGKPWEEVFRDALASYEHHAPAINGESPESVHAAMLRLGLLGCVTDAPSDLSTNPKYMEGFGSRAD